MDEFFPRGWMPYAVGGLLIGVATAGIFVVTGIRAGASGVLTAVWSWVSDRAVFGARRGERVWRVVFTLGLVAGGAAVALVRGEASVTEVPLWRLVVGGFLVGVGTRLARGCTSGHGICGLSSLNRASLIHVLIFMGVAILTVQLMARLS